jgi:hypothetical protein
MDRNRWIRLVALERRGQAGQVALAGHDWDGNVARGRLRQDGLVAGCCAELLRHVALASRESPRVAVRLACRRDLERMSPARRGVTRHVALAGHGSACLTGLDSAGMTEPGSSQGVGVPFGWLVAVEGRGTKGSGTSHGRAAGFGCLVAQEWASPNWLGLSRRLGMGRLRRSSACRRGAPRLGPKCRIGRPLAREDRASRGGVTRGRSKGSVAAARGSRERLVAWGRRALFGASTSRGTGAARPALSPRDGRDRDW